jgi:ketosteroid isomerase-like protein
MKQIIVVALVIISFTYGAASQTTDKITKEQPTASPQKTQVEQEIMRVVREWQEALKRRDREALLRVEAEEFMYTVGEKDSFGSREDALKDLAELTVKTISSEAVSTRIYGDVAVVAFRGNIDSIFKGKDFSGDFLETTVWVKRDGRWQVVAAHLSLVRK